jgi:hypothetical protein
MGSAIACLVAALSLTPQSHYKDTDAVWWFVRIDRAEVDGDGGYRVYAPASAVRLILTIRNQSGLPILVDADGLQRTLKIALHAGSKNVPVSAVWKTELRQSGDGPRLMAGPGQQARIEPAGWVEWPIVLQLKDAKPFVEADYRVLVELTRPQAALFWLHGEPFGGRVERRAEERLAIRAPKSSAEVGLRILTEATYALVEGRDRDAVASFQELLALDPGNAVALAGLGDAYMKLRMYREAADAYQRIRPESLTAYNYIPGSLAFAYVALGDETSASRVLQDIGISGRELQEMLTELRQRASAHRDQSRRSPQ